MKAIKKSAFIGALYTSPSFSSMVASNLNGSYTQVPNVSGTGAVFAKNHTTLAASGSSVSHAMAPAAIGPRSLRNGMAKKQLDRAAQSNGWMQWIQGQFCPELVLFGTKGSIGLNVAIK